MVAEVLPRTEILAGLAEECSELAQASLKLRRSINQINPTPVTEAEAISAFNEEVADVLLYLEFIKDLDMNEIHRIKELKKDRWQQRLAEAEWN